jgi:putative Holliday junction resolvase
VRLAVDVGSVRVGVARSDPGGILASPLAVLASGPGAKAAQARAELARLAASEGAIEVIVGLPTSLSGREGTAAAGAREFAADLAGRLAPVPVRLVDERFTTTEAHDALRRGGKDARARRQVVDAAAAAVLLQAALNAERATGRPARPARPRWRWSGRVSENGGGWPQSPRPPRHSRGSADPLGQQDPAVSRTRGRPRTRGRSRIPGPGGIPGTCRILAYPGAARTQAARTPGSAGAPEAAGAIAPARRRRLAPG